jgi:uncharacterized protein YbaP (TraB family)
MAVPSQATISDAYDNADRLVVETAVLCADGIAAPVTVGVTAESRSVVMVRNNEPVDANRELRHDST